MLSSVIGGIKGELKLQEMTVRPGDEDCEEDKSNIRASALPGQPQFFFFSRE